MWRQQREERDTDKKRYSRESHKECERRAREYLGPISEDDLEHMDECCDFEVFEPIRKRKR